jgi:hypothetical protein
MTLRGKTFLLIAILAGIASAATLRLTLYSDAASKYSGDSNKQLQNRALALVKKIRELVDSFNKKDREMMADYEASFLAARTTDRQRIREQYKNKLTEAHDSSVLDYKKQLLSESKAVREELHKRLPGRLHRSHLSKMYDNPSKVLELQTIADDLELLSKSLPDT